MIRAILFISILIFSCSGNNSNSNADVKEVNSVDSAAADTIYRYVEAFKGILKCKDCKGIETEITFINDILTYKERSVFIGKDVLNNRSGSYTTERGFTNEDDATVYVLDDDKRGSERYFLMIDQNTLLQLDSARNIIDSTSERKLIRTR